jgi:propionyl-CoA carboxylase alpha chain
VSAKPETTRLHAVLVANRGEIAHRVFRSAAARGMRTVAVFSDADAYAPYVREADLAVRLPGVAPADTYLRGDLLIAAAKRAGADCIHPGYGFLSENAAFAAEVEAAGLTWIGPPPRVIAAMGSKLAAKALMVKAGVPTAAWVDASELEGAALTAAGAEVGFPLLVKASFGGGGRGMRSANMPAELAEAVAGARREAASAFADPTVFLEQLVRPARHVEVQIFGDAYGTVVALHERDCSVQRRHQKVIEEAPSPAVDEDLRRRLCAAAVSAGEAVGYVGAGTVEFLLAPDGSFFFLEMNTRLQVEHPVTEAITGLDLVDLQFAVASGEPLPAVAQHPSRKGAAIEVRLYAEDPGRDWLPQSGTLDGFDVPALPGIRVDSGVQTGSTIGVAYDPMLAKIIAWAPDRVAASSLLASALRRTEVSGLLTNRDLLVRILESDQWVAGELDIEALEGPLLAQLAVPLVGADELPEYALAAALAQGALRRRDAPVLAAIPSGWRSNPSAAQAVSYQRAGQPTQPVEVRYAFRRQGLEVAVDGLSLVTRQVAAEPVAADRVEVSFELDGLRKSFAVQAVMTESPAAAGLLATLHVRGPACAVSLHEVARFPEPASDVAPGSLTASMPGTVLRVLVGEGDEVAAGQAIVVLEAMKMEHTLSAPAAGTLTQLAVSAGSQVETGALLAVIASPEPAGG